jgi:hypothetical protein
MNWEAIGAVGEIVGALAVVISLLYLALQIRNQVAQARLEALHDMSKEFREVSTLFATPDIADLFVRANNEFDSMSDSELVRLIVVITNLFRAWEEAFLEMRDGHLEVKVWEDLSRDYTQAMTAPSFRRIWLLRKQNYDPGFQSYADNIIRENQSDDGYHRIADQKPAD